MSFMMHRHGKFLNICQIRYFVEMTIYSFSLSSNDLKNAPKTQIQLQFQCHFLEYANEMNINKPDDFIKLYENILC